MSMYLNSSVVSVVTCHRWGPGSIPELAWFFIFYFHYFLQSENAHSWESELHSKRNGHLYSSKVEWKTHSFWAVSHSFREYEV